VGPFVVQDLNIKFFLYLHFSFGESPKPKSYSGSLTILGTHWGL
jgi:hypothetical protein